MQLNWNASIWIHSTLNHLTLRCSEGRVQDLKVLGGKNRRFCQRNALKSRKVWDEERESFFRFYLRQAMMLNAIKVFRSLSMAERSVGVVWVDAEVVKFFSWGEVRRSVLSLAENCARHPKSEVVVIGLETNTNWVDAWNVFAELLTHFSSISHHRLSFEANPSIITQIYCLRWSFAHSAGWNANPPPGLVSSTQLQAFRLARHDVPRAPLKQRFAGRQGRQLFFINTTTTLTPLFITTTRALQCWTGKREARAIRRSTVQILTNVWIVKLGSFLVAQ